MNPPPPPPAEGFASRLFAGPALRTQSDRRLVKLVREGYESAFEEIVRRYAKPLGGYAAGIVGSRSEDVTQDAFSKALLALRKDSEADIELRPWLYRIVRNTALNDLRDGPPAAVELIEPLEGGTLSAAEEFERRQELEELLERLRALPDPQRAAIVMRELEGLGHEEIANSLGMSGGAARQAIFRAREALRDGLGFLIPLPLLKMLLEHGAGAEAGVAAGGAALAAGGAAGAAGGAGTALKVGVVTAVLAGSVGTGLAVKDRPHDRDAEAAAAATRPATSGGPAETGSGSVDDSSGSRSGEREAERGEDSSGPGGDGDGRNRSDEDGDDLDSSGPGSIDDGDGREHSGESHSGGGGPGPSGGDDGGHHGDGSGTSGSGSGTSGSGSGTSGSGGSGSYIPPPPAPDDGSSSGPGSGGDSFDSDSSGSGSGDDQFDSSGSGSGVEGSVVQLP